MIGMIKVLALFLLLLLPQSAPAQYSPTGPLPCGGTGQPTCPAPPLAGLILTPSGQTFSAGTASPSGSAPAGSVYLSATGVWQYVSGTWSQLASGSSGSITGVTAGTGLFGGGTSGTVTVNLSTPVSVANGGTGTSSPSLVAGSNVTISGTWPNQTINSTGGAATSVTVGTTTVGSGTTGYLLYNNGGALGNEAASSLSFAGSQITSGTVSASYLPTFGTSAAGIVGSSGGGTTNFLRADGSWTVPTGSGNVSGPGSSTSGYIPQWSGTTGTSLSTGLPVGMTGNSTIVETTSGGLLTASLLPTATSSTLGGVKPDGTTIANSSGAISVSYGTTSNTALQGNQTFTGEACYVWDSNTTVTAGSMLVSLPWTSGTVSSLVTFTGGSSTPGFTAAGLLAGSSMTGCSAISVSGTTPTATSCTANNTWSSANPVLTLTASSPSGTPQSAQICAKFTHSVN